MKFERDKMDFELQMKAGVVKKASSEIGEDEEGEYWNERRFSSVKSYSSQNLC